MFEDSRRVILEKYLKQAILEGLTKKLACWVLQGKNKFEFHAGASGPETEYDLASLTKIFCTTLLTAQAIAEEKLKLDEQPWPNWPGVTVEHILNHRAGLPPWVEIQTLQDVFKIKPVEKPNQKTVYSDMGFIALGALLEERLGESLDKLCETSGMHFRKFSPLEPGVQREIELVDDPRCRALGGVAGHSGLFGTLRGVCEESLFFLKCLKSPQTQLEYTIKAFAEYPGPRGLGFDKTTQEGSVRGVLSEKSIGHLGYTGTSVWIDPAQDAIYILLMHRLKDIQTEKIMNFRREFHRLATQVWNSKKN